MPTGFPWAFFLSCLQEASRPGLGFLGCKSAEDCKTILFFLLLAIFCTGLISVGRKRRGTRRASGSKIAEDRKLYVFIVTSDLLQLMWLFDLQNQDSRGVNHKSRSLRCRGTEGGCKATSKRLPCIEYHHQINI